MGKKLSSCDNIDIIESTLHERTGAVLTEGERERLFWLFDNKIDFSHTINRTSNTVDIQINDEIDSMGYKLRWHGVVDDEDN